MTKRMHRQYSNELINIEEMISSFPYTRKGYKEGHFKKYEYVYDEYNDIYICPNNKDLIPTGKIDKNGYMIYKADIKDCNNCPFKEKCTKGKYKQRPQHIERVFADGKMKYDFRKTYFKTKEKVHRELTLLYACMNLKKFALHHKV